MTDTPLSEKLRRIARGEAARTSDILFECADALARAEAEKAEAIAAERERYAKIAADHPKQPRKKFTPGLFMSDDDNAGWREEIRAEERGERIASEMIATAIRSSAGEK